MARTGTGEYAKRLKIFREYKDLTQTDLAGMIGTTQGMVARYELNVHDIPSSIINMLHTKLNMSLEWFFTGKGKKDYVPGKGGITVDLSTLLTENEMLRLRMDNLEAKYKQLHADFYAEKHGVK
jgi:transcriptional regulator with XRE-family HTH domain